MIDFDDMRMMCGIFLVYDLQRVGVYFLDQWSFVIEKISVYGYR